MREEENGVVKEVFCENIEDFWLSEDWWLENFDQVLEVLIENEVEE